MKPIGRRRFRKTKKAEPALDKICYVHDEISFICDELLRLNQEGKPKRGVIGKIKRMKELIDIAKEMGQNMEYRLDDYYEAIRKLGFIRDK